MGYRQQSNQKPTLRGKCRKTPDVQAMLAHAFIYPFIGPLTPAQSDTCSKLVSKAFQPKKRSLQLHTQE